MLPEQSELAVYGHLNKRNQLVIDKMLVRKTLISAKNKPHSHQGAEAFVCGSIFFLKLYMQIVQSEKPSRCAFYHYYLLI